MERIYEYSFPARERVPFQTILDDVSAGVRTLWLSDDLAGFAVTKSLTTREHEVALEYLAVDRARRSTGTGTKLLRDVHAGVGLPLVFEVEDPAAFPAADSVRRIAFYERNGATVISCGGYRAPATTEPGTFPMLLFALPGEHAAQLTGARLRELVQQIWVESYGRDRADPLLAEVLAGLTC